MAETESSREKIKSAALEEFVAQGYDGARMQAIADRAGVNKAMIHYYFHSKDDLFEAIIKEAFASLFSSFEQIWHIEKIDPAEVIPKIVHIHLQFLAAHPHLPRLIVRELNTQNPIPIKVMQELFTEMVQHTAQAACDFLATGADRGLIRHVDPPQTLWNFVALNLFYFIAQPILRLVWPEDLKDEAKLLARREQAIVDLLLYGLLPRAENAETTSPKQNR